MRKEKIIKKYQNRNRKQYYQENKEAILEYGKKYYQEHKEIKLKYQKKYHRENKERILEYNKIYNQENREAILESHKQWRLNNPEFNKQWKQEHKEEINTPADPPEQSAFALTSNVGPPIRFQDPAKRLSTRH